MSVPIFLQALVNGAAEPLEEMLENGSLQENAARVDDSHTDYVEMFFIDKGKSGAIEQMVGRK